VHPCPLPVIAARYLETRTPPAAQSNGEYALPHMVRIDFTPRDAI